MAAISSNKFPKVVLEERLSDGSDTANPAADHRSLFLGEDGLLRLRDSSGGITEVGSSVADIVDLPTAETDDTLVLAPDGAGGVEFRAAAGGGGGGGLVLLGGYSASASAALDVATRNAAGQSGAIFQSDFDDYQIELVNLAPATDGAELRMRVSTDGGSTYDTSTIYEWRSSRWSNAGDGVAGSNTQGYWVLDHQSGGVDNSHGGVSGSYKLLDPLSATTYKGLMGQATLSNNFDNHLEMVLVAGRYASDTAVNAFRLFYSSGNLASGTVRVYGLAK